MRDSQRICCFVPGDDAIVLGTLFALGLFMAKKSLEERVTAIEVQLAGKTLQEHFREQAELIDQRFAEQNQKWETRFGRLERDVGVLQTDVGTLKADVSTLKADVSTLKADVSTLKKDMVIVRDGISILLKRGS